MEKIQELTEKIYREGVEKGQQEAERIVAEARQQAEKIETAMWTMKQFMVIIVAAVVGGVIGGIVGLIKQFMKKRMIKSNLYI